MFTVHDVNYRFSVMAVNIGTQSVYIARDSFFSFFHLPSNEISQDGFYKWICFTSLFLAGCIERKPRRFRSSHRCYKSFSSLAKSRLLSFECQRRIIEPAVARSRGIAQPSNKDPLIVKISGDTICKSRRHLPFVVRAAFD